MGQGSPKKVGGGGGAMSLRDVRERIRKELEEEV